MRETLRLLAIVYVSDMARSFAFYRALGFVGELPEGDAPVWLPMQLGGFPLALHTVGELPHGGQVGIAFSADDLDAVAADLRVADIEIARPIQDEPFGRSLVVRDPDGLLIQINEH